MNYLETLKRILREFKNYVGKPKFYAIIVLAIIVQAIIQIIPLFWGKAISYVELYLQSGNVSLNEVIIFLIIWLIYAIFASLLQYIVGFNFIRKNLLFYHIQRFSRTKEIILNITYGEYLNRKMGKIYKIINRGVEQNWEILSLVFQFIFPAIFSIIIINVIIFSINVKMALITIIPMLFTIYISLFFLQKTRELQEKNNKTEELYYEQLGNYMNGIGQIKILTFEKSAINEVDNIANKLMKVQLPISFRWRIGEVSYQAIYILSKFLILGFGFYFIVKGEITFATVFLFYSYSSHIFYPIKDIGRRLRQLQRNLEGIKNMYEEFDTLKEDSDFPNSKELKNIEGKLHFNNVSFSYKNGKNVLKELNFKINPGEKIAIVGNTGGGKSTIVSLIVRFFEVSSGEILIDDKNIQNFTKASLRKNIGIVMQDNSLFNTTIEENLKFAKPNATEKEMIEALKKAKADFVFETPDGIKSEIGERGLKLSGGEKQRLCIARVFLKDPKILILDEATSALDNKTEKQIQKTLDELMIGKTTIIIAHRLSTIKNVDKIIVLEKGKIIETGKYDELMKAKGKFFELATAKSETNK